MYAITSVQVSQDGLKLNGTYQFRVYADANTSSGSVHIIKQTAEDLVVANKETGLEENVDKNKYMIMSRDHYAGRNHDINIHNSSSGRVKQIKYLGTTLTNQTSNQEKNLE